MSRPSCSSTGSAKTKRLARAGTKTRRNPLQRLTDQWQAQLIEMGDTLPDVSRLALRNELLRKTFLGRNGNMSAALALMEEDFSAAVHTMAVPTHIIWGANDPIAPLRVGELLAGKLPNAELHVMPGVGHVPMSAAPEQLNRILNDALTRPPQPSRSHPPGPGTARDISCNKRRDRMTITGSYKHIRISHCSEVQLERVTAESIAVDESNVLLDNVRVKSSETAFDARDSVLRGTLVTLEGRPALRLSGSHLDLAGSTFLGDITGDSSASKLYLSVSQASGPAHTFSCTDSTSWARVPSDRHRAQRASPAGRSAPRASAPRRRPGPGWSTAGGPARRLARLARASGLGCGLRSARLSWRSRRRPGPNRR